MNDVGTKIFENMLIGIQLYEMNARGQRAIIIPPCDDLPKVVHKMMDCSDYQYEREKAAERNYRAESKKIHRAFK